MLAPSFSSMWICRHTKTHRCAEKKALLCLAERGVQSGWGLFKYDSVTVWLKGPTWKEKEKESKGLLVDSPWRASYTHKEGISSMKLLRTWMRKMHYKILLLLPFLLSSQESAIITISQESNYMRHAKCTNYRSLRESYLVQLGLCQSGSTSFLRWEL